MKYNIIKEDDLFCVTDKLGRIPHPQEDTFGYGLFTKDTRVLSRLECAFEPLSFTLLDADVRCNYSVLYRYINTGGEGEGGAERDTLYLTRRQTVDGQRLYDHGTLKNYGLQTIQIPLKYYIGSDFQDMFEVRGHFDRQTNGMAKTVFIQDAVQFRYQAIDGLQMLVEVQLQLLGRGDEQAVVYQDEGGNPALGITFELPAGSEVGWILTVDTSEPAQDCQHATQNVSDQALSEQLEVLKRRYREWIGSAPRVFSEGSFDGWYQQGLLDVRMLVSDVGHGLFPTAGVPWYAVPFGRDSLITSLQLLPAAAFVARGTLLTMAAHQGERLDPSRDEQPGKIMHELRGGELTRTGAVPFGPYFGTIDATMLFLILAAEYFMWSQDNGLIERLLPHVERAFAWIEQYGDRDGDGFVEYFREANNGISNQGWKDSGDSVRQKDGSFAHAPIALCEVQGYVYRAFDQWSVLYEKLGNTSAASHCRAQAAQLQQRFIEAFWLEDSSIIALALDGNKAPVAVASSNMGQVLWSGILPETLANRVIDRLMEEDMFTGFGIRTLSSAEVAYNPLSYHNGSVWPHDNSLIFAGMRRYGRTDAMSLVIDGLLKAAKYFDSRLPELYCGFAASETGVPVPYLVSCSPQAWAAATPVLALQVLLGLQPDALRNRITLAPVLLPDMDRLMVQGLVIADGQLDVLVTRSVNGDIETLVQSNSTGWDVEVLGPSLGGDAARAV